MQFTNTIFSIVLATSTVMAQNSICGSQIYAPGTGQCFNGQLCLYATDANTGAKDIITYPCGSQCYDAAKYICSGGVLVVATGTASTAVISSTAAQTSTQGATASATPIQSGALLSSQSQGASSAARVASSTSAAAASSSSASSTSSGHKVDRLNPQLLVAGAVVLGSIFAGVLA